MDYVNKLFKVWTNTMIMIKDRGYDVPEEDANIDFETFYDRYVLEDDDGKIIGIDR